MSLRAHLPPKRLIIAYALDWLLIICIAAVGGGINYITPYRRPFSLLDLDLSYPYVENDLISTATLVVLSLIVPAVVILLVIGIAIPAPSARRHMRTADFWKSKLWEINAGWMGLGLSFVLSLFFTQGIKNLFGRPRPDLLARCLPDLTNIQDHVVGGYGQDISSRWTLVSASICQQTSISILNDGFRSFLSGHASTSWSGLFYLSLWLAVKLNITIPYFHPHTSHDKHRTDSVSNQDQLPLHNSRSTMTEYGSETAFSPNPSSQPGGQIPDHRNRAAGPPVFGPIIIAIPVCVALYICSTRYVDFKHKGVDISSGSLLGIFTAWLGFRFYHSSITEGNAWTWGPRSSEHAFAVSTGNNGWLQEPASRKRNQPSDSRRRADQEMEAEASGSNQMAPDIK